MAKARITAPIGFIYFLFPKASCRCRAFKFLLGPKRVPFAHAAFLMLFRMIVRGLSCQVRGAGQVRHANGDVSRPRAVLEGLDGEKDFRRLSSLGQENRIRAQCR